MSYLQANTIMLPIQDSSIDCVVTSCSYWGRRNYGDDKRELGKGSLDEFLFETALWLREVARVLRPDGVLWLNIGDTMSKSGGAGGDYNVGGSKEGQRKYRQGDSGLPRMQQCLVPEKVAVIAQKLGWLVRKRIVWDKGQNERQDPSHVRRPLDASEMIFMLARGHDHQFNVDAIVERGDVWHFPPVRGPRKGPAPFPDELPRRCIALSTQPGDRVLDPFCGVGTTVRVANQMGRVGFGADLYLNGGGKWLI